MENFFYWNSKEKTLLTLNVCAAGFFGLLPLLLIPLRYIIVIGLWLAVAAHSPCWLALGKALMQIGLEYGIVIERWLPGYMDDLFTRCKYVYIPKILYFISWIPLLNRCLPPKLPKAQAARMQDSRSKSVIVGSQASADRAQIQSAEN